jgi:hypothetical protein
MRHPSHEARQTPMCINREVVVFVVPAAKVANIATSIIMPRGSSRFDLMLRRRIRFAILYALVLRIIADEVKPLMALWPNLLRGGNLQELGKPVSQVFQSFLEISQFWFATPRLADYHTCSMSIQW